MFPASHAKNQIGVGDFTWVDLFTGFSLVTVGTVSACFCYSPLIDLVNTRQDDVILMICDGISITAVGILAEMYLFEDIAIIEIIYLFC